MSIWLSWYLKNLHPGRKTRWCCGTAMESCIRSCQAANHVQPTVDRQWMEDRIWTWIHYTATRAARGELFEAIRFLSFLLWTVLGPIAVQASGGRPHGLRRFEQIAGTYVDKMRPIVASYDKNMVVHALFEIAENYRSFRKDYAPKSLTTNPKAESVVMRDLGNAFGQYHRKTT